MATGSRQTAWRNVAAVTLTLVVFLGGLAIGAAAASSTCEKIRQPLKLFSWIELSLGAFGLLFPLLTTQASLNTVLDIVGWFVHLLTHLDPITAYSTVSGGILINTSLAAATLLLLIGPTVIMGATLPLAARAAEILEDADPETDSAAQSASDGSEVAGNQNKQLQKDLGYRVNSFYLFNLLGAVVGAGLAAFVFLPWVGLADTIRIAAATNLFTALMLLLTHRYLLLKIPQTAEEVHASNQDQSSEALTVDGTTRLYENHQAHEDDQDPLSHQFARPHAILYSISFMSAAILLALQVTWIRTFSLLFGSSTYAVAAVIASSLTGLAIGSWFARFILRRGFLGIRFTIAAVFSLAALLLGGGSFAFESLPWWLTQLELCLSTHFPPLASYLMAAGR